MKNPEEMTLEELKEFAKMSILFENVKTPFYNVTADIKNQLTNYSRN